MNNKFDFLDNGHHNLKIKSKYFDDILHNNKTFELRKDDRCFEVGDIVRLWEVPEKASDLSRIMDIRITYILRNCPEYGLKDGYCIFAFEPYV